MTTPTETPTRVRVDVWSDIACPWCYVGKRRLEQALAAFPQRAAVDVVWHSFELDGAAPLRDTRSTRDILAGKYGRSPAQAQAMLDQMTAVAAAEGLDYRFERVKPCNTFLAHQLIHFAAARGRQDAMKERLMRAYFTDGEPLGDGETLVRLAAELGLDAGEAREALASGRYALAVRADEQLAETFGITGVPFFVLGGQYGVSGAQSAEVLTGALAQVWAERQPLVPLAPAAQVCEDGSCALPEPLRD